MDNPFIERLYSIKTTKNDVVVAEGNAVDILDPKTGQYVTAAMKFIKEKRMDNSYFVKEFPEGIIAITDLSTAAQKVIAYIKIDLGYQSDVFVFDTKKCQEITGIKDKSRIYRAIKELKEKHFVANAGKARHYFINPMMFYRGDRIRLLNKHTKIRKKNEQKK